LGDQPADLMAPQVLAMKLGASSSAIICAASASR
jgi:hypothetical protein